MTVHPSKTICISRWVGRCKVERRGSRRRGAGSSWRVFFAGLQVWLTCVCLDVLYNLLRTALQSFHLEKQCGQPITGMWEGDHPADRSLPAKHWKESQPQNTRAGQALVPASLYLRDMSISKPEAEACVEAQWGKMFAAEFEFDIGTQIVEGERTGHTSCPLIPTPVETGTNRIILTTGKSFQWSCWPLTF